MLRPSRRAGGAGCGAGAGDTEFADQRAVPDQAGHHRLDTAARQMREAVGDRRDQARDRCGSGGLGQRGLQGRRGAQGHLDGVVLVQVRHVVDDQPSTAPGRQVVGLHPQSAQQLRVVLGCGNDRGQVLCRGRAVAVMLATP